MKRILIVADDTAVCGSLVMILADEFEVTSVTDPQEAVRLAGTEDVDLLIVDMDGPLQVPERLMSEARRRHPHLPILMLSVYFDRNMLAINDSQLPSASVPKPFDNDMVLNVVRRLVGRTNAHVREAAAEQG